jgi:hypothetical protein
MSARYSSNREAILSGGAIAKTNPDDLGRRAAQNAESMKVLVFGHEHTAVLKGELPDLLVGSSALAKQSNVQRFGKTVTEKLAEFLSQLLVE